MGRQVYGALMKSCGYGSSKN